MLFRSVEICAGTANFIYGLVGGRNAKFPISRMGNKLGYRTAIYNVLGLRHGQGADAVVLIEAEAALCKAHRLLITPEGCRAVAAVIRGWVGEDARALWDRLRAEPVPEDTAEAVGAWIVANEWTIGQFVSVVGGGFKTHGGFNTVHALGGSTQQRDPWGPDKIAARVAAAALSWPPVRVVEGDVCGVEASPEAVAKWLWLAGNSWKGDCCTWKRQDERANGGASTITQGELASRCERATWPPTVVAQADVGQVQPGVLPEGTVVYCDPPYAKTTGYAHDLPREKVLEVAQRWAAAGAVVCVSEAEPLPLDGWHHVEITGCRVGQKRTFSKQKREWLTLNREPAWRPGVQRNLFALGEVSS